tara:strand:+ start:2091 stop:2531 length:441 start_codon:yes stop_codon:yes gene_type:complete
MRVYLLVLILFISSCFNFTKQKELQSPEKIISLEKTACFGRCPVFKIIIYNNGECLYNGIKFVKKSGEYNLKINEREVDEILSQATEIGFDNLKNEYSERITDLPTTYIMINNKKIKDYYGAPTELKDLEKLIEKIILDKLKIPSF